MRWGPALLWGLESWPPFYNVSDFCKTQLCDLCNLKSYNCIATLCEIMLRKASRPGAYCFFRPCGTFDQAQHHHHLLYLRSIIVGFPFESDLLVSLASLETLSVETLAIG